jgi:hypothetical protein
MSEQQPPAGPAPLPPDPPPPGPAATPSKPRDERGSLLGGIGIAWAVMVGGSIAIAQISVMLWPVPPVALLIWAVVAFSQGKTRTGQGMLLGLVSVIAVVLLLVAACFGLLYSGNGFH